MFASKSLEWPRPIIPIADAAIIIMRKNRQSATPLASSLVRLPSMHHNVNDFFFNLYDLISLSRRIAGPPIANQPASKAGRLYSTDFFAYATAMTATRSRHISPRKQNPVEAIASAAESLFGRHGIDRVSLREIAAAAGQRNLSAVQYHFGDKRQLIRAIYERRMIVIEQRRAELLSEVRERGRQECLPDLVRCLFKPIVELVDCEGRHSYGCFLSQTLNSPFWCDIDLGGLAPVTRLLTGMIAERADLTDKDIISQRFSFATLSITHMLFRWDAHQESRGKEYPPHLVEDAFKAATRIFA